MILEGLNSRSGSGQHLMPLRLRADAQRRSEKQRENHNETNLQCTLSGDEVQNGGRAHQ